MSYEGKFWLLIEVRGKEESIQGELTGQCWVDSEDKSFLPLGIVACVCQSVRPSVTKFVHMITHHPFQARLTNFGPKMQNTLVKVPIVLGGNRPWPSRSNLRLQKSKFTPFWACPHHNSSPIQARITKFGPEVQNTLVKIPKDLGGNWPWPSRSSLTFKVKFSGFTTTGNT